MRRPGTYELELKGYCCNKLTFNVSDVLKDGVICDTLNTIPEGEMLIYSLSAERVNVTDIKGRECGWCYHSSLVSDIRSGVEFTCTKGKSEKEVIDCKIPADNGMTMEVYHAEIFVTFTPRPEETVEESREARESEDA